MVIFSQCLDCKNFIEKNAEGKYCCIAFPEGIPYYIFWNKVKHDKKIEGDNGIVFEPLEN